ncbi:MAG TPA: DDE-type integrase/transposase/recombinase [Nitrososphaerales archaeon]|nr:DDE-type integrase/transposase/recombinase [Nitrososphaerales archaeon]
MATATELRQTKGKMIANMENQIERVFDFEYLVNSQSKEGKQYRVVKTNQGWGCTCPDYLYRAWNCKHIYAVQISFELRQEVAKRIIEPVSITSCQFCGSQSIKKYGIRKTKNGQNIQRFICEFCNRTFSLNIGFEKMKHNPQAITTAMQLYFSGESLRNTQKSLRLLGVQVCHRTVYNWIQKYSELMAKYADKINPGVSDVWRADEIYVKVRGDQKYLFALMDDETRYWIAQEVADTKEKHNPRGLFAEGKEITGKRPVRLITDGLESYHNAWKKEFRSNVGVRSEHIQDIAIDGKIHNNKMERMNGEIRDREKTMRGLKIKETPILKGMQIFHNFIRTHEGLKGKTPGEACGIEVKGENKWKTLIENASVANKEPKAKERLEDFA